MAEKSITKEYRCGYCYQEFNSMIEPRELPCHHVFCIKCLKDDYKDYTNITCPSCAAIYKSEEFIADLPPVILDVYDQQEAVPSMTALTCDCNNCEGEKAVSYCSHCFRKICDRHQQLHDSFFGDSHSLIQMSVYEMSPKKYNRIVCTEHKEELLKACQKCAKIACNECDIYTQNCTTKNNSHRFTSLNKFREEITAHFNNLLKCANEKLTEICKLDKQLWKILDEEEVECKEKVEMIDRICEEQIKRIKEECSQLKERIYEYQRRLTNQIGEYDSQLLVEKQELEESRFEVFRWLRESHVTELVRKQQQYNEKLMRNLNKPACVLPSKPVLVQAEMNLLKVQLTQLPMSLTLNTKLQTGSPCYSAHRKKNGDLLVGEERGLEQITMSNIGISSKGLTVLGKTIAIKQNGFVYVAHKTGRTTTWELEVCLTKTSERLKLLEFDIPGYQNPFFAVSNQFIAIRIPHTYELAILDFVRQQDTRVKVKPSPRIVHFLHDGDLLVTGLVEDKKENGVLTRYSIVDSDLTVVWRCEGIYDACGVCANDDGLIYISSFSGQAIYIVSPEGKILHKLTHEQLPERSGQISVRGDDLVIPSYDEKDLFFFKIVC